MNQNSVVSFQIHSYTLICSMTQGILRILVQVNHHDESLYISSRLSSQYFPQELQIIFQNVNGLYEYIYKIAIKNLTERVSFRNGLLMIKVYIDDKVRQIPIKMRKMRQDKQNRHSQSKIQNNFLLTSIPSEKSDSGLSSKAVQKNYPAPRLKLMMLKQNNKIKKALSRVNDFSSSSVTQAIREHPHMKMMTYNRYDTNKIRTHESFEVSRKVHSEEKASLSLSKAVKKNIKEANLDLSNKQLGWQDIKQLVSYDWSKLILLNLGYNNITSEGLRILTSVKWPALRTLYVCFDNISKVEWTPSNICFVKTLSLSGNKIKDIPKNITDLQFLEQLFIYNNKIELLIEQLIILPELKNLSIYGNKLDPSKNRKITARLKTRKVQIWQ